MTRRLRALLATVLTAGLFGTSTLAQAPLNESPITPGFWSVPSHRAVTAQDVIAACRNHFEIRFADGHFIGLRMHKTEGSLVQREIEDVGRCAFDVRRRSITATLNSSIPIDRYWAGQRRVGTRSTPTKL
jgi:hypothetical protein